MTDAPRPLPDLPALRLARVTIATCAFLAMGLPLLAAQEFNPRWMVVIPCMLPVLAGVLAAWWNVPGWVCIVAMPAFQTIFLAGLICEPVLGVVPVVAGSMVWMVYIQAFLFRRGCAELMAKVHETPALLQALDPRALLRVWVIRSFLAGICSAFCYGACLLPAGGGWLLGLFLLGMLAYGIRVWLELCP